MLAMPSNSCSVPLATPNCTLVIRCAATVDGHFVQSPKDVSTSGASPIGRTRKFMIPTLCTPGPAVEWSEAWATMLAGGSKINVMGAMTLPEAHSLKI